MAADFIFPVRKIMVPVKFPLWFVTMSDCLAASSCEHFMLYDAFGEIFHISTGGQKLGTESCNNLLGKCLEECHA